MAIKNTAITVCYVAWNTSTNAGQTGDSANHTLKLVQDGTEAAPTNNPAQVDSTNLPGVYSLALTAGDMNFNCVVLGGKSSTANVVIIPLVIITERGNIATGAAPGAANGLFIAGTNAATTITTSLTTHLVGTVDTVTTLTNLPSIPNNWLTAAGIASAALNGKGDWLLASNAPSNFAALGITVAGKISEVVLCDTLTTYTGNTPQTGDAYARLGLPAGASVSADIAAVKSETDTILNDVNSGAGALWSRIGTPAGASIAADIASVKTSVGTVTTVTNPVAIDGTVKLGAARALDSISDTNLTWNDVAHCAIANAAGKESVSGTTYLIQTPSTGTTLRTFTLDSGSAPTQRS